MEGSEIHKSIPEFHNDNGFFQNPGKFLDFSRKNDMMSRSSFFNSMAFSLLNGAEKVLMARKSLKMSTSFNGIKQQLSPLENEEDMNLNSEPHEVYSVQENENVCGNSKYPRQFDDTTDDNDGYIDVPKVVNCPSGGYNDFPLNFLAFLALLVLKSVGFQISLLVRFFTLPIWLSYIFFMFFMFPFQTVMQFKEHLMKKLLGMLGDFYAAVTSFICDRFIPEKSIVNLGRRFGLAFFWSIYVCFMLLGLLVSGFVIGGLNMRLLVEEPIQTTKTLNFDYTKASPVAFVPITSSPGVDVPSALFSADSIEAAQRAGARFIPYNHKLQLTITLTLPESEYNRKLGVFQVRVEFLSANGKVIATSSYPCMLRFKSQPIRYVETIFKSVPLIAGFQSESQILNTNVRDFTERYEPTACFKVILEQRAEYQRGAGIPEIYDASLALESELPQMKRIIWHWRRTIFVWISIMSFLTELVFVLIFFRPLIIPRGRPETASAKKDYHRNKISWYKSW
ncbi:seipin-2-like [Cornus florida]|uniref:seipin-2-like n=1 Tax=Cornus florida TaxID=4283 RepID=UPI0028986B54|nr:seipin-2-like [Cornus florida]